MKRLPAAYVVTLGTLAVIAVLVTFTFLGVPPFDNLSVWILTNVVGFFTLLVLGVVGGAFLGMLLAHRLLAGRQFTPFERTVLQGLEDVKARLEELEKRVGDERRP